MKKSGIYKITNTTTNEVYIGKSIDIEKRFNDYKNKNCKLQRKLFNSFFNYGILNHKFDILELCNAFYLDIRERHWQLIYDSKNKGLNCVLSSGDKYESYSNFNQNRNPIIDGIIKNWDFFKNGEISKKKIIDIFNVDKTLVKIHYTRVMSYYYPKIIEKNKIEYQRQRHFAHNTQNV